MYRNNYTPLPSGICSKYARLVQHSKQINQILIGHRNMLKKKKLYNHISWCRSACIWNAKDCHCHGKLETEARKNSSLQSPRDHGPADTFIWASSLRTKSRWLTDVSAKRAWKVRIVTQLGWRAPGSGLQRRAGQGHIGFIKAQRHSANSQEQVPRGHLAN